MRNWILILISPLLLATVGCNNKGSSVAAEATPPSPTAVGPIPGTTPGPQPRTNPLANDPVALQDGPQALRLV